MKVCAREGCGKPLPPNKGPGQPRKWCSELCRKSQYHGICIECGGDTDGTASGKKRLVKRCFECERSRYAERNAAIFARWAAGETAEQIGPDFGMSATAVSGLIQNHRLRDGEPHPLHRRRNRELWPEIERLWNEERLTARKIGERLGATKGGISMMIQNMRRAGITVTARGQDWRRRA